MLPKHLCINSSLCSLFKNQWFGGVRYTGKTPRAREAASAPPASPSRRPPGCEGRTAPWGGTDAGPRPKAKQPETTAQLRANLGLSGGADRQRSGSWRLPAQHAHTRRPSRRGPPGRHPGRPTSPQPAG